MGLRLRNDYSEDITCGILRIKSASSVGFFTANRKYSRQIANRVLHGKSQIGHCKLGSRVPYSTLLFFSIVGFSSFDKDGALGRDSGRAESECSIPMHAPVRAQGTPTPARCAPTPPSPARSALARPCPPRARLRPPSLPSLAGRPPLPHALLFRP